MKRRALAVAVATALAAGTAAAQPAPPPAPAADAAAKGAPFAECVTDEERKDYELGKQRQAFGRSPVPLPPLLYMSRDRTFVEAMFLYWSSLDIEQGTRLRLFIPFFLQSCTPRSRTLVTPLFGMRDDAEGTAGFVGPYYYRRDRTAQSDVLFPLFWRIVDPDRYTFALLNFYTHRSPRGGHGGFVPLAFWGDSADGSHYTFVPPLFWRWGDRAETTTILVPGYKKSHLATGDWDFGVVPLYFGARHGERYYDFVVPPLYWQWGDEGKREHTSIALAPPGYYHRKKQRWDAGLVPLYFGGRDGAGYYDIVPPLLFGRWGDPKDHTLWILNNYYHRYPEGWTYSFFPLYFGSRKTDGSFYDVGFPLYWRFGDREKDFGIALQTYWKTSWWGWDAGSLPFFAAGRSREGDHYTAILPPLYINWGDKQKESTLVLNTYYGKDHTTGDYDFTFFPLAYAGRRGQKHLFASPLYLRWGDETETTTIIPPGYYHADAGGYDLGIFPLLFRGARPGGDSYTVIPPLLFFNYADATESVTWALLGYHYRAPDRLRYGVFPFFFRGVRGEDRYTLIPPLLTFDVRDATSATTVVLNTYYRRGLVAGQGDPEDYDFGFVPLWFQGKRAGRRYTFSPLALFFYDRTLDGSLLVAGPFYRRTHATGWDAGFAPLYFGGRDGPKSYHLVPPLLTFDWSDDAAGERTTVFPLGYRHRRPGGSDFGVFPFYFQHERGKDHLHLAPLLLTAHWGDAETENTIATLYYSFEARSYHHRGLFPLYLAGDYDRTEKDGGSSYRLVLPPLYINRASPQSETTVVLQSWLHRKKGGGWDAGSFPFYAGGRGEDGSFYDLVLPPLFASWGDKDERTTIATLYYDRETAWGSDFGFAPLYFGGRSAGGGYYDVAPLTLFARWGEPGRERLWAGPFYRSRTGERRHFGLFPLYFGGRGTGENGDGYYDHVLPPLFMRWGGATTSTTVGFPFYYSSSPDGYHLGVMPLLFMGRHDMGERHYTFVPPLFWRWGSRAEDTTLVLPFGWHKRGVSSSSTGIIPFYFAGEDGPDHWRAILPPLYINWGDSATETTVALTYFNRTRPDGHTRGVLPFYVESRSDDRWFRMVTPLFYQWGDFDSSRALLFPLAYYERQGAESLFLAPLVVSHRNDDEQKRRLVVFPFWWQFKGPDSDVNVGFPLWWDFRWHDEGKRLSILAPLGFQYETPDETSTLVLNTFYSRSKDRKKGGWSFYFFPLLSLETIHEDHFKWQFLYGLIGKEREFEKSRWRVFWVWTDPS